LLVQEDYYHADPNTEPKALCWDVDLVISMGILPSSRGWTMQPEQHPGAQVWHAVLFVVDG
jgi:hypothetical protein